MSQPCWRLVWNGHHRFGKLLLTKKIKSSEIVLCIFNRLMTFCWLPFMVLRVKAANDHMRASRLFKIKASLLIFQNGWKNVCPIKFFQSDHPIRPDLRFSGNISWPGGGQGNKWILSCVFKAISHSLLLPLFLMRPLDICVERLWRFPGSPLPHLLLWNSNKKYLHRGTVFYFPCFHPFGEPSVGQPCAVLCSKLDHCQEWHN